MNERVVLGEFQALDQAVACHDTPAYKEALKALGTGNVERDMRVVEGVAQLPATILRKDACGLRQRDAAPQRMPQAVH